jgi:hypothetical protein
VISDRRKRSAILHATARLPRSLRVALRERLLARLELARARRAALLILGHPKSGNTWLRTMLSRLYQVRHALDERLIVKSDELAQAHPAAPRLLATNGCYSYEGVIGRVLAADAPLSDLHQKNAVRLVRHPCDIAVSWYLQFVKRQSAAKRELINHGLAHPIDHRMISMWDFVMHGDIGLRFLIDYLNTWERNVARMPHAITLRYEDMRARPVGALQRVVDLLDPSFTPEAVEGAVEYGSFDNLRRLEAAGFFRRGGLARQDPADPDTFKVRRGKVGGYRDYFSPAQVAEMDALVAARLSPTLGYGPPARLSDTAAAR